MGQGEWASGNVRISGDPTLWCRWYHIVFQPTPHKQNKHTLAPSIQSWHELLADFQSGRTSEIDPPRLKN